MCERGRRQREQLEQERERERERALEIQASESRSSETGKHSPRLPHLLLSQLYSQSSRLRCPLVSRLPAVSLYRPGCLVFTCLPSPAPYLAGAATRCVLELLLYYCYVLLLLLLLLLLLHRPRGKRGPEVCSVVCVCMCVCVFVNG